MLTSQELANFKNLYISGKISSLDEVIWANMTIDYDQDPQKDSAPEGELITMPVIAFKTSCHIFNVLLDLAEGDEEVDSLDEEFLKSYLQQSMVDKYRDESTIIYCIQEILKQDWSYLLEEDVKGVIINSIKQMKLEEVQISYEDLTFVIIGNAILG